MFDFLRLRENQDEYSSVIRIVDEYGQRKGLITRLRKTHPRGTLHLRQYDAQFWSVWTEAKALAWAATVGGYGYTQFTDDIDKPDLLAPPATWIEVKTIKPSEEESVIRRQMEIFSFRGGHSDAGSFQPRPTSSESH